MSVAASPVAASSDDERRHGTVGAALRYPAFRTLWIGMFLSSVGTWMQTVVLPAYVATRTNSGSWVGLFIFAQLGPLLLLSILAGALAERFPRRIWLTVMQAVQGVMAVVIAWQVSVDASLWAIFGAQLASGVANAFNAPAMQATLPNMVDRRDLGGVVSLNSVMINGTRVLGPVLAALLVHFGATTPQLFLLNAVTYLFVIAAILLVEIPTEGRATDERGLRNLTLGLRIARHRSVLGRLLLGMTLFSLFSLIYVGQLPVIVSKTIGLNSHSNTYLWLYATWGTGALVGALLLGTVFAQVDKATLIRPMLIGFAVMLGVFAALRSIPPAFPVGFLLGGFYFAMATSMLTIIQQNLLANERARVLALWFMAFGGAVSIGNLAFGPILDSIGPRPVMALGVVVALWLSWWCDVPRRGLRTLAMDEASLAAQRGDEPVHAGDQAALDEHGLAGGN